ncbi:hypothetical protein DM860_003555 [Cuscuta australis]|uniref:CASP-like protein n=1 Tax=Cuscuta australis TaxID=267555 RepID=A0A328DH93_9ASTE|nr:hypothetical protein DM860_003555 [Cuscuta australis]
MMALSQHIIVSLLRVLALGGTLAATIVMVTSHDSFHFLGFTFVANFTNSPTFKYFVAVNALVSGYGIIVLFIHPNNLGARRVLLVSDMVVTLLMDSSISACIAVGEVGKKGNNAAGWLPICGQVSKFCGHVEGAIFAAFLASLLYFLILFYSFHTLLNNFYTLKS